MLDSQPIPSSKLFQDLTDKEFEDWTVMAYAGKVSPNKHLWICKCKCGSIKKVRSSNLKNGGSRGCKACSGEKVSRSKRTETWHIIRKNPLEYRAWKSMKSRCLNDANDHFQSYGGRGISFHRSWFRFENFLHDMGPKPSPRHTLERRNNDRGYGPRNCYWATAKEQSRNKQDTVYVFLNRKKEKLIDIADRFGIKRGTLYSRIFKYKWPVSKAVNQKPVTSSRIGRMVSPLLKSISYSPRPR